MKSDFLTLSQFRQFEIIAQKTNLNLMNMAADSVVTYIKALDCLTTKTILVVVGNGNNGGDGVSIE